MDPTDHVVVRDRVGGARLGDTDDVRDAIIDALRSKLAGANRQNEFLCFLMRTAGHDLKQPLQVIGMFLERVEASLRAERDRYWAGVARNELSTLNDGLVRLLLHSQWGALKMPPPVVREFSVCQVLAGVVASWAHHAARKGISINLVPSTATIRSDPELLFSSLGNLVANAIKYTASGRVLVGCRREGSCLRIEVHDQGQGIAPCQLTTIFEPFRQLDATREGCGLGLAIVRQAMDLLGHDVSVRSSLGVGSCFRLHVPLVVSA